MTAKYYIHPKIIKGFENKQGPFKYTKLVAFLKSLNRNYAQNDPYACAPIIRAILDITPPLLGFRSFDEIVSNYPWPEAHKKYMEKLLEFKNEGDDTLHTQLSARDSYLNMSDLPTQIRINTLLEEYMINAGKILPSKISKPVSNSKISFKINEEKLVFWDHYIMGFNQAWAFRVSLEINNFQNNKPDYIHVKLKANTSNGPWESQHFTFYLPKDIPDKPFEIQPHKIEDLDVFLSQDMPQHTLANREKIARPDLDTDTVILLIKTASGIEEEFPIKSRLLQG